MNSFKSCDFVAKTSTEFLIHLKSSNKSLETFVCPAASCGRAYGGKESFKKHLSTCRASLQPYPIKCKIKGDQWISSDTESLTCSVTDPSSTTLSEDLCCECLPQQTASETVDVNRQVNSHVQQVPKSPLLFSREKRFDNAKCNRELQQSCLLFIAKLHGNKYINRSMVQEVILIFKEFVNDTLLNLLRVHVLESVSDADRDSNFSVSILSQIMSNFESMWDGFLSEYSRFKLLEEEGVFIKPQPYHIGVVIDEKTSHGKVSIEPVTLKGQFIPLSPVLKKFLELPYVFSDILLYMNSLSTDTEDKSVPMENLVQGFLWQKHILPKFSDKTVLPLTIFFDDFEPDNALGSHSSVHKLGAVYVEISCISPKYRAVLENKFLALLFHSTDRNIGNAETFRPLLNELRALEEEGILVTTNEGVRRVYFALAVLSGDNLGIHGITGFAEGFTANFPCRICKEPKEVIKFQTVSNDAKLRTVESYNADVSLADVSKTGIRENCVWNILVSFHVLVNLYCDLMHDLLEGVCHYDMCAVISYITLKGYCTYDNLNSRVQGFQYGYAEMGNKPPIISQEHVKRGKLGFSSAEMLCLVRYFGQIIGDQIPENDPVWLFYLSLCEITDILFAPCISQSDCDQLKENISKHHEMYISLFNEHLRFKHHIMLHYDHVMKLIGPLLPLCGIRWESKHKELKHTAVLSCNRLNLPVTVALKCQLQLALRFLLKKGFIVDIKKSISISPTNAHKYQFFSRVLPISFRYMKAFSWIQLHGTRYDLDSVVVISLESFLPLFAQIEIIIQSECPDTFYVVVNEYHTYCFDYHFHAYEVVKTEKRRFICLTELVTHTPTCARICTNGKTFISFRYKL